MIKRRLDGAPHQAIEVASTVEALMTSKPPTKRPSMKTCGTALRPVVRAGGTGSSFSLETSTTSKA